MLHKSKNDTSSLESLGDAWEYVKGVKSIDFYRNDAKVNYMMLSTPGRGERVARKEITEFSMESRARLAFVANNTEVDFTWFITLTYPKDYETDGKEVKRHLNKFLSWARSAEKGVQYLWFLEFQKRGAPHFHILLDRPLNREKVSLMWYKHVNSGDKKHLLAGTRVERIRKPEGARRYVNKYAHKIRQKEVPGNYRNVGRFWGCSSGVKPEIVGSLSLDGCEPGKLVQAMDFWDYVETLRKRPLTTLYGVSGSAGEIMKGGAK